MRRLVIWGAGELGGRVARLWSGAGGPVLAFTRTTTRHDALRQHGAEPRTGDPLDALLPEDVLLLSLPGTAAQSSAVASLAATTSPARTVMVSSTGFHAGASGWVDEGAPPGSGDRARAIAACEDALLSWSVPAGRGVVLRCGGLYRAGRGPLAALRRAGRAPPGPPDTTLALVHYDDAAASVVAALQHAAPAPVYLCITPPVPTRREFWEEACRTLGAPPPEFDDPVGRPRLEYDVRLLRRDLLPEPARPDWRAAARA